MAKIRTRPDGVKTLTLSWQEGRYLKQEEFLNQHQKSGEATRVVMDALFDIADAQALVSSLQAQLDEKNKRIDSLIQKIEEGTLKFHERLITNLEGGTNGEHTQNEN